MDDIGKTLKRLSSLYLAHQRAVNWFLAGTSCVLALIFAGRPIARIFDSRDLDKLLNATGLLRDTASIVAITVAGLWSYYVFVRGRTFAPRARLQVNLREVSSDHSAAIIRFALTNIGRIKLSSLKGHALYFTGERTSNGIVFKPVDLDVDLLKHYRGPCTSLMLEPGGEINIDASLVIKDFPRALLLVKSVFKVNEQRTYKENAIFCLDNTGGAP